MSDIYLKSERGGSLVVVPYPPGYQVDLLDPRGDHSVYVIFTAAQLHELADWITTNVPKPDILDTAKFIRAKNIFGSPIVLAKFGESWYTEDSEILTEEQVRIHFTDVEEIV